MNACMATTRFLIGSMLLAAGGASARPRAVMRDTVHDFGEIQEGERSVIQCEFSLKNTGSDTLIVKSVRPDCGCTMVGYDTVIAPGAHGAISPKVELEGITQGYVEKHIAITTNDTVRGTFQVVIKGKIKPIIRYSPGNITLSPSRASPFVLKLQSEKPDLAVTSVYFVAENESGGSWRSSLPLYIKYTTETPAGGGGKKPHRLILRLSNDIGVRNYRYGTFVIETNHPGKKKLEIRGALNG